MMMASGSRLAGQVQAFGFGIPAIQLRTLPGCGPPLNPEATRKEMMPRSGPRRRLKRAVPALAAAALILAGLAGGAQAGPAVPERGAPVRIPVVHFRYETPGGREAAERCAGIWSREGPSLAAGLVPASAPADSVVCLVLDSDSFNRKFGDRLPDWGVGVALGPQAVALDYSRMSAVGRGLREVFLHEMVHVLLFQGAGEVWLPAWFHEGVAMQYSGEWRFSDTVSLVLDGRVPDLARLQGRWPGLAMRADRAYRTSLLAVRRLQDRFGPGVVADILAQSRLTGSFAEGFEAATAGTPEDFYRDFTAAMRLRFGWLTLMTRWPGLFVALALVLVFGAGRKIFLTRRRMALMEDEDSPPPGRLIPTGLQPAIPGRGNPCPVHRAGAPGQPASDFALSSPFM